MRTTQLAPLVQVPGFFATVFVDVSHDSENGEHEHGLRVRAACAALTEQGAPDQVVEDVARALLEPTLLPAPAARFVVATTAGIHYEETIGARVDQLLATWGPLPDLTPWVAQVDATVTFVLALVDHAGGDVTLHSSALPTAVEEDSIRADGDRADDLHKVSVGGWAERHYQVRAENAWRDSAEDVVDVVTGHVRHGHRLVLLSGDPRSVGLVRDRLEGTDAEVVELDSGQRAEDGGDDALQSAIRDALQEHVVARRVRHAHELRERLGRGHAVAIGVHDVADAFVRGQVETLLLDPATTADLQFDLSEFDGLTLGATNAQGSVRADQALMIAAVLTSADATVAPSAAMNGQPVAALLRWDQ